MHRYATGKIPPELQPLINRMTNHDRNRWARAGYPINLKLDTVNLRTGPVEVLRWQRADGVRDNVVIRPCNRRIPPPPAAPAA